MRSMKAKVRKIFCFRELYVKFNVKLRWFEVGVDTLLSSINLYGLKKQMEMRVVWFYICRLTQWLVTRLLSLPLKEQVLWSYASKWYSHWLLVASLNLTMSFNGDFFGE